MPRTGRPPIENPKDIRVAIRLEKADLEKLDACAKREKTSRSEIIRRGINLIFNGVEKK